MSAGRREFLVLVRDIAAAGCCTNQDLQELLEYMIVLRGEVDQMLMLMASGQVPVPTYRAARLVDAFIGRPRPSNFDESPEQQENSNGEA